MVGREHDHLGLRPEHEAGPPGEPLAAQLRQAPAGRDPELRGLELHQDRDEARDDDHPEEQVAGRRPGREVGRDVARVDVRDGGDERRPEDRKPP
jgi:hypothetical protein